MQFLSNLRALTFLKRIAVASERSAIAHETLAQLATSQWGRENRPRSKAEFGEMDSDYLNKRYAKEKEMAEAGMELEEDE